MMARQDFKDYPRLLQRLRAERADYAKRQEAIEAQRRERAAYIHARAVAFVETAGYETLGRVAAVTPSANSSVIDDLAYAAGYGKEPGIIFSLDTERFVETVFGKGFRPTALDCRAFRREVEEIFHGLKRDLIHGDLSEAA